jgi:hypothetical protein
MATIHTIPACTANTFGKKKKKRSAVSAGVWSHREFVARPEALEAETESQMTEPTVPVTSGHVTPAGPDRALRRTRKVLAPGHGTRSALRPGMPVTATIQVQS